MFSQLLHGNVFEKMLYRVKLYEIILQFCASTKLAVCIRQNECSGSRYVKAWRCKCDAQASANRMWSCFDAAYVPNRTVLPDLEEAWIFVPLRFPYGSLIWIEWELSRLGLTTWSEALSMRLPQKFRLLFVECLHGSMFAPKSFRLSIEFDLKKCSCSSPSVQLVTCMHDLSRWCDWWKRQPESEKSVEALLRKSIYQSWDTHTSGSMALICAFTLLRNGQWRGGLSTLGWDRALAWTSRASCKATET